MSYFQRDVSASKAALCYASEPAFAVLMTTVVFSQNITANEVYGTILLFVANLLPHMREYVMIRKTDAHRLRCDEEIESAIA